MIFDEVIPAVKAVLSNNQELVDRVEWALVNRDLNGRIRIVLPNSSQVDEDLHLLTSKLSSDLSLALTRHTYPEGKNLLFEDRKDNISKGAVCYPLDGFTSIFVVDRLTTETDWTCITPESSKAKRIVFFSIKGGVGRSTALAATAWNLAESGKRVLVLDLDLESPGLSTALLPSERQPKFGVIDWLVEDLLDNGGIVLESMVATSDLSHNGEIYVAPAHGREPGEYISKLGRAWMPKISPDGSRKSWSLRLAELVNALEETITPDVILIDSRSGIDETSSACLTGLGANMILLFALEGEQTWNGYKLLFEQWQRAHVTEEIRDRLKMVAAIIPELDRISYLAGVRERAYSVFLDTLYDELPPPKPGSVGAAGGENWRVDDLVEGWNFDEADQGAPHYPLAVNWHRSFAGLKTLQGRLTTIDNQEMQMIFGSLLREISNVAGEVL